MATVCTPATGRGSKSILREPAPYSFACEAIESSAGVGRRLAAKRERAVSERPEQLRAGQLGTADVTASTVANIGPGIDFYFAFGVIAVTAGVAAR